MNLYLRFFNEEVLVETVDQAMDFLSQLPEIKIDDVLRRDMVSYATGNNPYPRRFKVSQKAYFIVIKTTAATMEEFKAYAASAGDSAASGAEAELRGESEKESANRLLKAENPGWYHAVIRFKRVMPVEGTGKFRYVDTDFEVKLKAHSTQDCYNRVVDHLRTRADIDSRSQFPSIRGRNFKADFLGM